MSDLPILYPCHLHSWFSLGDSVISPKNLTKRMKELGLNKTAVTDHGNVLHVIRFNSALQKEEMTLYPGEEFYYIEDATQKDSDHRASYHLTIVAYNQEGLSTLYKLSSLSYIDGFYFKPKIDLKMLQENNKGIRVSSACIKGLIANEIINDNYENAKKVAQQFKDIFGENFYLEIMPHNLDEQRKANLGILKISEELNIPLLATYDAHMCWQNCANACANKCPKVFDKYKRKIAEYEFIKKGIEVFNIIENPETGRKRAELEMYPNVPNPTMVDVMFGCI